MPDYHPQELIDTLWNVNLKDILLFHCGSPRINRYIMECKSDITASHSGNIKN